MNPGRDEEIAAAVGAHNELGSAYDDAIAAGLIERIGGEVDRRVDERMSQYQGGGRPAAPGQRPLTAHPGGQISWQQTALALGSLMIGAITSATVNSRGNPWPVIIIWIAIVVININIFRIGRRVRRSPD